MEHILEIKTLQGRSFIILNKDRYTLGRSSRNSIVIKDPQVSRYHATLIREKNEYLNDYSFSIYDGDSCNKKSTNGLIIERQYYSFRVLEFNETIQLGDNVKLKYYQVSAETLNLLKLSYKSNPSDLVFTQENNDTLVSAKKKKLIEIEKSPVAANSCSLGLKLFSTISKIGSSSSSKDRDILAIS